MRTEQHLLPMKSNINNITILFCFIFIAAFITGIIFRTTNLSKQPLNGDEGDALNIAKILNEKQNYWERHPASPPTYLKLIQLSTQIFPDNPLLAVRFWSLLFGILTLILLLYIGWSWFDFRTGIIAATLTSVLPFFVLYSRDGHFESFQTFVVILSIFIFEQYRHKNWYGYLLTLLVAFLLLWIKHNNIIIFGSYALFLIGHTYFENRQDLWKEIRWLSVTSIFVIILTLLFTNQNLPYYLYGIIFWAFNQSFEPNNFGTVYKLFVLLEGTMFLPFLICFKNKFNTRQSQLCFALFFIYLTITFMQNRLYPRHFMIGLPFMVLLVANNLSILSEKFWRMMSICLTLFVVLSTIINALHINALTTTNGIFKTNEWLNKNIKNNSVMYVDGVDYWTYQVLTNYHFNMTSRADLPRQQDYVITYQLQGNYYVGSPLQNNFFLFNHDFWRNYKYKTFENTTVLFQTLYNSEHPEFGTITIAQLNSDSSYIHQQPINNQIIQQLCEWKDHKLIQQFTSTKIKNQLNNKCTKGCVNTCEMF